MTIKGMTLTAGLTMACALILMPANAQYMAQRGGPAPQQGGPSSGPAGQMPPSRHTAPSSYGQPSGYPGAPGVRGGTVQSPSVPTRFGSAPDSRRTYGGPLNAPPMSSPRSSGGRVPVPPADSSRVQQALRNNDYDAIRSESQGVRSRAEDLQRMRPELSVQDRLKLPLIDHMYRQGADKMEEGRTQRDDSKIRYGYQRVQEAEQSVHQFNERGEGDRDRGGNSRGNRSR